MFRGIIHGTRPQGGHLDAFEAAWDEGVLRLTGELDVAQADKLLAAFRTNADRGSPLVVDLSGLEFIDSSGLRALTEIARAMEERQLVLRSPTPVVRRVFDVVQIDAVDNVSIDD